MLILFYCDLVIHMLTQLLDDVCIMLFVACGTIYIYAI